VAGHERLALADSWQAAAAAPGEPGTAPGEHLQWMPARVPGTAAAALRDRGGWEPGERHDFDAEDWWFRTSFQAGAPDAGQELALCLEGVATVCEVTLNGAMVLAGESMFARRELDVGALVDGTNELVIRCRALGPLLEQRRRPRARWRTRLVSSGNLRFYRTMLLGRAPGFAPGPAAVGPWRPVALERRRDVVVEQLELRPSLLGEDGVLTAHGLLRPLGGFHPDTAQLELDGPSGTHGARLTLVPEVQAAGDAAGRLRLEGRVVVPAVARWWPHTHGEPALHRASLTLAGDGRTVSVDAGRVGFRELAFSPGGGEPDVDRDGIDVHVNGVGVFARGAVWTPVDIVGLAPGAEELRGRLELVRDAGMNMLRIPGTAAYEDAAFHDLCDELGLLVWQDLMFANLDYPFAEEAFAASVRDEVAALADVVGGRPSLAVVCGNSEIEQQAAMLGLDPQLGRGEFFASGLPARLHHAHIDAAYVPSAPCGGDLPFRPDSGIANYYGVGGYRRGLDDARRSSVRFAAECLAFSNVPDADAVEELLGPAYAAPVAHHPAWKAGVPRDVGAGWDFEDVRDHYLALLYGVDPADLRRVDHNRYLELSRLVTGELMAEVFGEWRRTASPCAGGLVLWLSDLLPGAGWGLLDHRGRPKPALGVLARVLAPVAVWTTDEGLSGVAVHAANDRPEPLRARLRVALYRDGERPVGEVERDVTIPAHGAACWSLEALLGHFVDAAWAYRFGPPAQDAIVVALDPQDADRSRPLSSTVRFPAERPLAPEPPDHLGLEAVHDGGGDGKIELLLSSRRLAYGVRVHAAGWAASDDLIVLEPGVARAIALVSRDGTPMPERAALSAVNMQGSIAVSLHGTG
jgi:beta-mannosidase